MVVVCLRRRITQRARTVLRIGDDGTYLTLLGIGTALEVLCGSLVRIHPNPGLLRVLTFVNLNPQVAGDFSGLFEGVIDPSLPRAAPVHEHELRIVETDPNDDRFGSLEPGDVVLGTVEAARRTRLSFRSVFEGPRSSQVPSSPRVPTRTEITRRGCRRLDDQTSVDA